VRSSLFVLYLLQLGSYSGTVSRSKFSVLLFRGNCIREINLMNSITNRQPNPSPEIEYSEIHIPDEENLGTGRFTTRIKARTLFAGNPVSSLIVLVPHFQLSVNLNPATGKVPILLGRADRTAPLSRKVFLLPQNIKHKVEPH